MISYDEKIGIVEEVDGVGNMRWSKWARVRVFVNVNRPLKNGYWLNRPKGIWQWIDFRF